MSDLLAKALEPIVERAVRDSLRHVDLPEKLDLIEGAGPIAEFLFGDSRKRRKVFYLWETSDAPLFKLNNVPNAQLCARRSELMAWLKKRKREAKESQDADDAA